MSTAVAAAPTAPVAEISLYASVAYRWRVTVTAISLLVGLMVTLFSGPMTVSPLWLDATVLLLGWSILVFGLAIRLWGTAAIAGRKGIKVVCDGPYALCRNPLYWGTFLIAVSMTLFLQSGTFAVSLIPPVLLYLFKVVPAEERFLKHRLGSDYTRYCERTPRWWPQWNAVSLARTSPASSVGWYAECRRQIIWLLLPALAYATCVARNQEWWPQLFFFS
jgi:protein-S-isoprenylcysteine O-methyltransferase Ste14